jgi:hypothetical protein
VTQQRAEPTAEQSRTALPGRTAGRRARVWVLTLAVTGLALAPPPLAAQTPRFIPPPDVQQPTLPTQPPQPSDPGQPQGGHRRGRPGEPGKPEDEKDKKPQKFGPISVLPLQHIYFLSMGAPMAADPTADDARMYGALKSKQIGAWKVADGTSVWAVSDIAPVQPLVVDNGRLYAVLEAEIAAFDSATGKPAWRVPGGAVTTAPVAKSGWLIVALDTGEVRALRGETGEVIWQAKLGASIKTRPVIVGDRLYVAPQNHHLVALDLVSGQQLWSQEFEDTVTAVAAQDQRVFAGTRNFFFGLDHAGHVKWKRRVGAEVVGLPVTDAAGVYAVFTDNTLVAFGAGKGDLIWRAALPYRPVSGPARADDTLLLTGIAPIVHGYDIKDGKPGPDFPVPADPRVIFVTTPYFAHGPTFFQDTVLLFFAHGWAEGARRVGPGTFTAFTDPGSPLPALTFPGEAPPPPTAAVVPPKA